MIFTLGSKRYLIRWRHNRNKKHILSSTDCEIESVSKKKGEKNKLLYTVTVRRHREDPPCYEKARKFSLDKLLRGFYGGPEQKKFRTACWKAYLDRTNEQANEERKVKEGRGRETGRAGDRRVSRLSTR